MMMATPKPASAVGAESHDRMYGLDVCRTMAILSVVFGHMLQHSTPHPYLASVGFMAIFGVDLFFCLSGFLIGRILMQVSERWPQEQERGVMQFWYRRWMRTLPLYFFFLFVELQIYWGGASSLSAQRAYLVFAQNLAWPMPSFYGLTWSLTVEEWFYFLFPLLILLSIGFGKTPRASVLTAIVIFLVIPPVLRFFLFDASGAFNNLDPNIRHVVIFRLDSLGFGVLAAYIYHWHKPLFRMIAELRWFFIAAALACMAFIKWDYFGLAETNWLVTVYFSVVALVFAGLIPFFSGLSPTRFAWFNRFVKYTSQIAYSLYLGHVVAFAACIYMFKRLGCYDTIYPNPWLTYPIFMALVYLLASFTYFAIEKPLLTLRDRRSKVTAQKTPIEAQVPI